MEGGELARFFRAMGMGGEEETEGLMTALDGNSLDLQVLRRHGSAAQKRAAVAERKATSKGRGARSTIGSEFGLMPILGWSFRALVGGPVRARGRSCFNRICMISLFLSLSVAFSL